MQVRLRQIQSHPVKTVHCVRFLNGDILVGVEQPGANLLPCEVCLCALEGEGYGQNRPSKMALRVIACLPPIQ
jgi:hypothetical protein